MLISLPEKAEKELRGYFTSAPFPLMERAALITKTFEILPFKNYSETPNMFAQQGIDGFKVMLDLLDKDNLFGWVHSHPQWGYFPSSIHILNHNLFMHMVIFSVPLNAFYVWTPEQMVKLKEDLENAVTTNKIEEKIFD